MSLFHTEPRSDSTDRCRGTQRLTRWSTYHIILKGVCRRGVIYLIAGLAHRSHSNNLSAFHTKNKTKEGERERERRSTTENTASKHRVSCETAHYKYFCGQETSAWSPPSLAEPICSYLSSVSPLSVVRANTCYSTKPTSTRIHSAIIRRVGQDTRGRAEEAVIFSRDKRALIQRALELLSVWRDAERGRRSMLVIGPLCSCRRTNRGPPLSHLVYQAASFWNCLLGI